MPRTAPDLVVGVFRSSVRARFAAGRSHCVCDVGNLFDCGDADGVGFCSASHSEGDLNNAPKSIGPKLADIRKYGLFINMVG